MSKTTSVRSIASGLADLPLLEWIAAPHLVGLPVSDHQRLVCAALDGAAVDDVPRLSGWGPDIAERSGRDYVLGAGVERVSWPQLVCLLAGIRTGKSLIVAGVALRAAVRCDVSQLRAGEIPRVSVLSLRRDLAQVVREHLDGILARSTLLGALLVSSDADSVYLRHPAGGLVEIRIVAGAKAGSAVVARWSAGIIVDEAPRFAGADEGVVNLGDILTSGRGRLLNGAQVVLIGSPWAARGPVYDLVQEHWGRPSDEVCVLRASAPALNPVWWTPAKVAEVHAANQTTYNSDVLGEFVELATDALPSHDIDACRKPYQRLNAEARYTHVAAIDPALRLNAWTLVVMRRAEAGLVQVVLACQWMPQPGRGLDPDEVMPEIATHLEPFGVSVLYSDQHQVQALTHVARAHKLAIVRIDLAQHEKCQIIGELAAKLALRQVELPDNAQLCDDLRRVRRIATSGRSGLRIDLPQTADGRHCDYVPAIMLCLRHLRDPQPEQTAGDPHYDALVRKHRRMRLVRGGSRR